MKTVLLIGTRGRSTRILFNSLKKKADVSVIIEDKISACSFWKFRIRKCGFIRVVGQIAFLIFLKLYKERRSRAKISKILKSYCLFETEIPDENIHNVKSINSDLARKLITAKSYDCIIVSGTRIIGKKTLSCTNTKIVNIHAGITPGYRGVHGAYWALINKDFSNVGVTLHYVDLGVDTGKVISQSRVDVAGQEFVTYPVVQLAVGIKLLMKFLDNNFQEGEINSGFYVSGLDSSQYFHPTIWFYFYNLIFNGIK